MNRIRKGDSVIVISGKHKQKTGIVISVDPKNETAIVEGVNKVKKHQKKDQTHEQSGILEKEAPIRLCKLAVLETKGKDKGKPTKISFEFNKENKKVRVARKTRSELETKK
ncbi:50S ribosomal protein L24 [Ureaplasma miroungigenitalium]|uniref:Large ribosomal subunit protein uL24 n=1 Tax=Ureaplasma miroungigenitalium TaxID=1042321 RepID=A0ABT3BMD4_9BACT|nr:50S ribosomal protein L24 [Ureaplasma miroungigenitalium]MCV3728403.1 50S ribosomal protein L24 [Ureaplasma miroungigenitalium]MCV3734190.1 50S ribosomal protein L24 [Ureaplasma miroungigenitalium]